MFICVVIEQWLKAFHKSQLGEQVVQGMQHFEQLRSVGGIQLYIRSYILPYSI